MLKLTSDVKKQLGFGRRNVEQMKPIKEDMGGITVKVKGRGAKA